MKLQNPFGNDKTVWITQTYHEGGNNIAIDCITDGTTSGTPIYAMSDGTITTVSKASGSYLCKTINGSNFQEFYVHTARWVVKKGQVVKAGDLLGYIATQAENGGYPMHLHVGLSTGNYIMNYFDRGINFKTTYQDIANDWFNGSTSNPINWSLFQDLNIGDGFNNGDKIMFTGEQNIRVGSGLQYQVESSTYAGMKATIIENPRIADDYTWYDIKVDGGGTGWVADVNKFIKYTENESNSNSGSNSNGSNDMDVLQNLQQKLNETQDELDRVQAQMYEYRDKADKYFQLYQKVDIENVELTNTLNTTNTEIEQLKSDLLVAHNNILDLQEKMSTKIELDDYTTTQLLKEIVRRVFS